MVKILRILFELIHRWFPKRNHAVIYGWPDGEDQTLSLITHLRNCNLERIVILQTDFGAPLPLELADETLAVPKSSLIALRWFLTARYVFFTHRCYVQRFPDDVVSVNVWHGMPIKKIGTLLPGSDVVHSSHLLATSPFWGEIMRKAMCPEARLLNIGLPRNDRLFDSHDGVRNRLGMAPGSKILLWLPTYRHSVCGAIRRDGHDYGNAFAMPDLDPDALNAHLAEGGHTLFLKIHPMAMPPARNTWSHLKIIDDQWLLSHRISLYRLLGASDLLISDVSSVVIDYLLLDRPIIHAFPDLAEYRDTRGFTVEPIEDYLAGGTVTDQAGLLAALDAELAGKDPYAEQRRKLRDLSHTHQDGKATERLLEAIGLK